MENTLNPFNIEKEFPPVWISFCKCLLASMELILTPICSLLYLHSNDIKSLKSLALKKSYSYKYNCYKTHTNKVGM